MIIISFFSIMGELMVYQWHPLSACPSTFSNISSKTSKTNGPQHSNFFALSNEIFYNLSFILFDKLFKVINLSFALCVKLVLSVGLFVCLFGLILYVPVNNFSVLSGLVFLG